MNERATSLPFLLNEWERERVGNELIRADERRHEKVARTYQPNIVGLIWRCAGVGQHWPPHWSGDTLSDHPDQHRGYRGSRGPASFSRSRFRHLSRRLRGGSSWHWKPTRPIGPGSGIYISSISAIVWLVLHRVVYIRNWKAIEIIESSHKNREHQLFSAPLLSSSALIYALSRSFPLSSSFSIRSLCSFSHVLHWILKILPYLFPGFHNASYLSIEKKKTFFLPLSNLTVPPPDTG